ncbi:hypothetical protein [Mycolicibacterium sp.]|uniref:hypothetical protein n=1 Tax=Mycolicibacterium sp. TaxID=2320850 RepID=UPI0037CCBA6A
MNIVFAASFTGALNNSSPLAAAMVFAAMVSFFAPAAGWASWWVSLPVALVAAAVLTYTAPRPPTALPGRVHSPA